MARRQSNWEIRGWLLPLYQFESDKEQDFRSVQSTGSDDFGS